MNFQYCLIQLVSTRFALHMRLRFTSNPMMDFHLHCNLFKLVLTFFFILSSFTRNKFAVRVYSVGVVAVAASQSNE